MKGLTTKPAKLKMGSYLDYKTCGLFAIAQHHYPVQSAAKEDEGDTTKPNEIEY